MAQLKKTREHKSNPIATTIDRQQLIESDKKTESLIEDQR